MANPSILKAGTAESCPICNQTGVDLTVVAHPDESASVRHNREVPLIGFGDVDAICVMRVKSMSDAVNLAQHLVRLAA